MHQPNLYFRFHSAQYTIYLLSRVDLKKGVNSQIKHYIRCNRYILHKYFHLYSLKNDKFHFSYGVCSNLECHAFVSLVPKESACNTVFSLPSTTNLSYFIIPQVGQKCCIVYLLIKKSKRIP